MNRVKVLHIITRLIRGGAPKNTIDTVCMLRHEGYDVAIASGPVIGSEGELESVVRQEGIRFFKIPTLVRQLHPYKDIVSLLTIYRLIKKEKFNIVHTHTSKAGFIGRLAAKLAGVPVIIHTPHGNFFNEYFNKVTLKLYIMFEKISAVYTDMIIALSHQCRQEHLNRKIGSPEKFTVIPDMVDLGFIMDIKKIKTAQRDITNPPAARHIGTVARTDRIKGLGYFIDAAKIIIRKNKDIQFVIVGDGYLTQQLKEQIGSYGLEDRITITGVQENIFDWLHTFDIFVLPSLQEGLGMALLEAMAYGVPVIATHVGGIPSVVKNGYNGILIPPKNPEVLASAILDLLKDEDLRKTFAQRGIDTIRENFDKLVVKDKILNLYKSLLTKKGDL